MNNVYPEKQASLLIGDAATHLSLQGINIDHVSLSHYLSKKLEYARRIDDCLYAEVIYLALSMLKENAQPCGQCCCQYYEWLDTSNG
ncbi:hypothetical protein ACS6JK_12025 [Enterobacter chuandaensis]|uniref:hypothetical protein n=1 Tax=Enterobacter TaxID=547 RepID=UPI00293180E8|nr:hypothetical protein [Enterobacter sp. 296B2]